MSNSAIKFGFTAKKIIDEGRITEETINLLKTWLIGQNLPTLTDEQIVLFSLSCDNEQELTKITIEAFYRNRNKAPELFDNRKTERESLQKQLQTGQFCALPELTDDGCAIIFFRWLDPYYYNFELEGMLQILFMILDAAVYDYPPKGLIMMYDLKDMSLMHLTRLRPGLLMKFFNYVQEGLPVKLKCMHLINSVSFLSKIIALIRPFAKPEVLDAMHFHPPTLTLEEFHEKCIPKRCLPEDYGGNLASVEVLHQETIKKLINMESHFDAEELQRHSVMKFKK